MANPAELHAALVTRLRTLTTVEVFDGDVPSKPPASPHTRQVFPYAVVWGTAGYTPSDARASTGQADGALVFPAPITVAAGQTGWCLEAASLVRRHLDGYVLIPGASPLTEDEGTPGMQRDMDVSPVRYFVPMIFRCFAP